MNKDLLKVIIREYFDGLAKKNFPEYILKEKTEEVIELCYEAELDSPFINTLIKDAQIK